MLDRELLIHPALGFHQPLLTRARHRPRVLLAPGLDTTPGFTQPRPPTLRPHLIPARIKVHLDLLDHLLARFDRDGALTLESLAAFSAARLLSRVCNCSGSFRYPRW